MRGGKTFTINISFIIVIVTRKPIDLFNKPIKPKEEEENIPSTNTRNNKVLINLTFLFINYQNFMFGTVPIASTSNNLKYKIIDCVKENKCLCPHT